MGSRRVGTKNKTSYYKIEALSVDKPGDSPDIGKLHKDSEFVIEGEIDNHVIISVSPTMSERAVGDLINGLSDTLKSQAIVVTHNVHFLKAQKLSHKEALKLAKRVSDDTDDDNDNPMDRPPVKVFGSSK